SMGAARKLDPQKIRVAEFYDVEGCPLARAIRQRLKRMGVRPRRKFKCVYSPELIDNQGSESPDAFGGAWDAVKGGPNGSLLHITGIFGFTLAGLVISDLSKR
ncbi:MAG: tRNA threonylcarbamoyladenosine dehydratase, partial [Muribaculaceae bacterium]|nr:tRNA threonylcarbamoyladenosine dehydratase [Muribaculaceae bacterium]